VQGFATAAPAKTEFSRSRISKLITVNGVRSAPRHFPDIEDISIYKTYHSIYKTYHSVIPLVALPIDVLLSCPLSPDTVLSHQRIDQQPTIQKCEDELGTCLLERRLRS
jgi:hypothetical protein